MGNIFLIIMFSNRLMARARLAPKVPMMMNPMVSQAARGAYAPGNEPYVFIN